MAKNKGTLVPSTIRPNSENDTYATIYSNEAKGGHHVYDDITGRNNISYHRRQWGMIVTVLNENKTYQLRDIASDNILDNNNWVVFDTGFVSVNRNESWLDIAESIISELPNNATAGNKYLIGEIVDGVLAGKSNHIAEKTEDGWIYHVPLDSQSINIKTNPNQIYKYIDNKWTPLYIGAVPIKYHLIDGETVIIPERYQYLVYGDMTIDVGAEIINHGRLTIMDGNLIIYGSIINSSTGTISLIGDGTIIENP